MPRPNRFTTALLARDERSRNAAPVTLPKPPFDITPGR